MKRYVVILMQMLLLPAFLVSCSVKEDRSACPCRLHLDFSGTDTVAVPQVRLFIADDGNFSHEEKLNAPVFMPEYVALVPRSMVYVNVFAGEDVTLDARGRMLIPEGSRCPRVSSFHDLVDAGDETAGSRVQLHKNHCVMTVRLNKNDDLRYGLCLRGNVCGYGVDGAPLDGGFSYSPQPGPDGTYVAVIPRQKDQSLMLEVDDGSDVLKHFAIGEYIAAGGYDWKAADLEDIEVTIDWAQTTISLVVSGWDWVKEYEIVI